MTIAISRPLVGCTAIACIPWGVQFAAGVFFTNDSRAEVFWYEFLYIGFALIATPILHTIAVAMSLNKLSEEEWLYLVPLATSLIHVGVVCAALNP